MSQRNEGLHRERVDGPSDPNSRVPVRNAPPPVQAFVCTVCGEVSSQPPVGLPVFEDCDDECQITACLIARDSLEGS